MPKIDAESRASVFAFGLCAAGHCVSIGLLSSQRGKQRK